MMKVKFLMVSFSIYLCFFSKFIWQQPPVDRQKLIFQYPAKSVQDSLLLLRKICESVDSKGFMNCFVQARDSVLYFKGKSIGRIDTISVTNNAFENMKREDAIRLISVMKFLRRNFISGFVHDASTSPWLYSYRQDVYHNTITTTRHIYIWNTPQDTLKPIFKYYFKILDRKERMILVGHNDVPYKRH